MSENRQRSQITEDEKLRIMKDIETKTEKIVKSVILSEEIINPINQENQENQDTQQKLKTLINQENQINQDPQQNLDDAINILQNIMRSGGDEFKEKVGRPMTYSEMREMFG